MVKKCMLEDNKICDNCLECDICDLDPNKVCDNCAKCIDSDEKYRSVTVEELIEAEEVIKKERIQKAKIIKQPNRRASKQ